MFNKIYYCISKFCGFGNSSDEVNEDDMDDHFFDAETGSELMYVPTNILETCNKINEKNVFIEQSFKALQELYKNEKDKQTSRELQLQRYEDTVQKLQLTLVKQQLMIEKKNSYHEELLNKNIKALEELYKSEKDKQTSRELQLQRFEETVNKLQSTVEKQQLIIETQKTFIERSYNTPNIKYDKLKNKFKVLEREVANNTTHIIAMNYSLTRINLGVGTSVPLASNLLTLAPSCPVPSTPPITQVSTDYAPPPQSRPPPPPPPPPPSPSSPPMTQVSTAYVRPQPTASPPASKAKVNTVQAYRIPITKEILKSVILKPPGERVFKTKVDEVGKSTK